MFFMRAPRVLSDQVQRSQQTREMERNSRGGELPEYETVFAVWTIWAPLLASRLRPVPLCAVLYIVRLAWTRARGCRRAAGVCKRRSKPLQNASWRWKLQTTRGTIALVTRK